MVDEPLNALDDPDRMPQFGVSVELGLVLPAGMHVERARLPLRTALGHSERARLAARRPGQRKAGAPPGDAGLNCPSQRDRIARYLPSVFAGVGAGAVAAGGAATGAGLSAGFFAAAGFAVTLTLPAAFEPPCALVTWSPAGSCNPGGKFDFVGATIRSWRSAERFSTSWIT